MLESRWFTVLADAAANTPAPEAGEAAPGGGLTGLLPLMAMLGMLFYFMILRPQKAKEQRFREMVAAIKENDRVVTIGGIYGVVTNVQRDNDRITLRVDESNNTKIRVTSASISRVLTDDTDGEGKASDSPVKK